MAEAVEALCAEAPLVLVLEDLHWGDAATVDLVALLARRREAARLLLIGTYRPVDLLTGEHPLRPVTVDLLTEGRGQEIALEPLGEAPIAQYLGERFPRNAFPSELARVIGRRTEGNPLFVVSVADDLVARGLLATRDDRWELRAAPQEVEGSVPENLRQMIERRIGQLDKDEQAILAAGSVAGMEFSVPAVAAALGRLDLDIEERCGELARRQLFIRPLGAHQWPDRTVAVCYGFVHALHRNTFYQAIPSSQRRLLHQAIGDREEAGYGGRAREIATRLAAHFEQAGDARRAVHYLSAAADTASRRHANAEAVGYVSHALDLARRLPDADRVDTRLVLLKQLGLIHRAMGDVRASIDEFTERARYAREHGLEDEEARALLELAGALSWLDRDRSLTAVEQALALVPRLSDDALRAHVRATHGFQRILQRGWRDEDAEACRVSIGTMRRASDRRHLSLHLGRYAYLETHRSEYRVACRTAEESLRLAREVSDPYHYMAAQFHRAWALLHLGQWGEMRGALRDGLDLAERNGHHLWARTFRFQMAWLLTHVGDFQGAVDVCERERRPFEEIQLGQFLGSIVLGFAQLGLKRHAAALRAFEEAARPSDGGLVLMDWILNMPLRLGLGQYWLARRNAGRAREEFEALCRLAATSGERTYLGLGHDGLAEVALAEGDRSAAERRVSDALRAIDGAEAPVAEWRICVTAARTEEAAGRVARAHAHWERSATVLGGLAASLEDDDALRRRFLAQPAIEAVRRSARRPTAAVVPPAAARRRARRRPRSSRPG
jgi:tetratricopeptide (TPR) repeat protein